MRKPPDTFVICLGVVAAAGGALLSPLLGAHPAVAQGPIAGMLFAIGVVTVGLEGFAAPDPDAFVIYLGATFALAAVLLHPTLLSHPPDVQVIVSGGLAAMGVVTVVLEVAVP